MLVNLLMFVAGFSLGWLVNSWVSQKDAPSRGLDTLYSSQKNARSEPQKSEERYVLDDQPNANTEAEDGTITEEEFRRLRGLGP